MPGRLAVSALEDRPQSTAGVRWRIRCGDRAPDFTLADQDGALVQLARCYTDRMVMLVFYCGVSCTTCIVHLYHLRELLWLGADIDVLAVGIDGHDRARGLLASFGHDREGRDLVLLDDPALQTTDQYGLLDPSGTACLVPATPVHRSRAAGHSTGRNGECPV